MKKFSNFTLKMLVNDFVHSVKLLKRNVEGGCDLEALLNIYHNCVFNDAMTGLYIETYYDEIENDPDSRKFINEYNDTYYNLYQAPRYKFLRIIKNIQLELAKNGDKYIDKFSDDF